MGKKSVAILGAGPSGLSAADYLSDNIDIDVVIIERKGNVGGLCGGETYNDIHYEYGPHSLHSDNYELISKYVDSVGSQIVKFQRTCKIKFRDSYIDYPLRIQSILKQLGIKYILSSVLSWVTHFLYFIILKRKINNSEDLLKLYYGPVIYKTFFEGYSKKVWGIPLSEMSYLFAKQRVPVLDTMSVLKKIGMFISNNITTKKKYNEDKYKELVTGDLYHTKKGHRLFFEKQYEKLLDKNVSIHLRCEITCIIKNNDGSFTVKYSDPNSSIEHSLLCHKIISTIPVPSLVNYLSVKDKNINLAAKNLKYKPHLIYGMLLRKSPVLPCMFIYYRDSIFNRVTDLAHFGVDYIPKGYSVVLFEVHCDRNSEIWVNPQEYEHQVLDDMVTEGIALKKDVIEIHHLKYEHAYPLYDKDFKSNYSSISSYIKHSYPGLHLTGRQGLFQFINIHMSILVSQNTAKDVENELNIDNYE